MKRQVPGLDRLTGQLRSALLNFLDPDEKLLWVGQPGPMSRSFHDRLVAMWGMTIAHIMIGAFIKTGVAGIVEAARLWVPGGTLPMLYQVVAFGLVAAIGIFAFALFWLDRVRAPERQANTVYAVTTTRVLGFEKSPTVNGSWQILLPETQVDVRNVSLDGSGDVVFSGGVFSRIPDANQVAALILDAIELATEPKLN